MLTSIVPQWENIDLMSQKKAETSWERDEFHDDSLFFFFYNHEKDFLTYILQANPEAIICQQIIMHGVHPFSL